MRKRARSQPAIRLKKTTINELGTYCVGTNTIHLTQLNKGYHTTLSTLIHEITHWAQYMYLDDDEIIDSLVYCELAEVSYFDDPLEKMANYVAGTPQFSGTLDDYYKILFGE